MRCQGRRGYKGHRGEELVFDDRSEAQFRGRCCERRHRSLLRSAPLCPSSPLCPWHARLQPSAAVLTEFRVRIVRDGALDTGACRLRRSPALPEPLREVALDLIAVTGTRVELLDQPRGPRPQTAAHVAEVVVRELAHGAIELEVL